MARYEEKILNKLVDTYENSLLSQGKNRIAVHIAFPFTPKNIPEYFNESSLDYEDIHACIKELEQKNFIRIIWKKGKENHIVQKILLREERIEDVYRYLKRKPKADGVREHLELLESAEEKFHTPITQKFIRYLKERIQDGKPVREYIELSDEKQTDKLLQILYAIETNTQDCYIREFSIRHLGNSKAFEALLGTVGKILKKFQPQFAEMDTYGILAENFIYHTPDYVYLKGQGIVSFKKSEKACFSLSLLKQGIGISGDDISGLEISGGNKIKKIITVENLTTFFRWEEEDSLIVYLGGYHNQIRRELLHKLYQSFPDAAYLHFGDIDVGGFEIYLDLCKKTGIPFETCHMGIAELKRYESFTQKLTENDRKRLDCLLEKEKGLREEIKEVLTYMKEHGIKLEQEAIGL